MRRHRQLLVSWVSLAVVAAPLACRDFKKVTGPSANGGSAGSRGGAAGAGGTSSTSGSDPGAAGENGLGGVVETAEPVPASDRFGTVRLIVATRPTCGGTLINNSWVLTTDSCVPANTALADLEVAIGWSVGEPEQVERVVEIVRFPGNDGTAQRRGRNLVLLGVEDPFQVEDVPVGYHQPIWPLRGESLEGSQRCGGWSFSPDAIQPGYTLRVRELTPFAVDTDVRVRGFEAGDWLWWERTTLSGVGSVLPTLDDMGTGCFLFAGQTRLLTSIHSEIPETRRDGSGNPNLESVSTALAEPAVRAWIDRNMVAGPEILALLPPVGPAVAQWSAETSLELVAVSIDTGTVVRLTRKGMEWNPTPEDLGAPDGVELSKTQRPSVLYHATREVDLLAADVDGRLWWKRYAAGEWADWSLIELASGITCGVHAHGRSADHFHVVTCGRDHELRHAEFEAGGWLERWENIGGPVVGEPALDVVSENQVNVFFRGEDDALVWTRLEAGRWTSTAVPHGGTISSSPAVGRWSSTTFDLVALGVDGVFLRREHAAEWSPEWNVIGPSLPPFDPTLALSSPGHAELFVTANLGIVWRIAWPRRPSSSDVF